MLLSNLVSEMVIVTVPPLALCNTLAAMAPPYKVDVPPHHMQHRAGSERVLTLTQSRKNRHKHLLTE